MQQHDDTLTERAFIGLLDNLRRLPQLFRMHGILRLSPALADTIATEQYVDEGSAQEVELRAVSVDRCDQLFRSLRVVYAGAPDD